MNKNLNKNSEKEKLNISKTLRITDLKNGGLTGFFTILLIQPFQVIKTSMIIIHNNQKKAKMLDIIKRIKTEEGLMGFYRGFLPSVIKSTLGYSIFFASLEFNKKIIKNFLSRNNSIIYSINSKDKYKENKSIINNNDNIRDINTNNNKNNCEENKKKFSYKIFFSNFLASGISRFIQACFVNPIMVIKTRNEVLGFNSYKNILDAVKKIKKEEGIKGFYSGLKTTLLKDVPASGLFYMLYELIKNEIISFGVENIQIQAIFSSSLTSLVLVLLTNPLEVIRTRQQYQHFSSNLNHEYSSVFQGIKKIYKFDGINGFFVGITPRLMKKGLGSIIVWTTYETLKKED